MPCLAVWQAWQISHLVCSTTDITSGLQHSRYHIRSAAQQISHQVCSTADITSGLQHSRYHIRSAAQQISHLVCSTADITSGLQHSSARVFTGLRNFPNKGRPKHHSIDRLKERGVEKESGRHSILRCQERSVFNQTKTGTVSRVTLGRLLRDGAERVWAFPSDTMPS